MNQTATVTDIDKARVFSDERYRLEREEIRKTYGESSAEAAAKRDQALAALFYRCGWTQEQLAKAEGKVAANGRRSGCCSVAFWRLVQMYQIPNRPFQAHRRPLPRLLGADRQGRRQRAQAFR